MKKMKLENILHSRGYVSIETLIIAGLIIASGSFMVSKFALSGKGISDKSNNSLTNSKNILDDNDFSGNKPNTPGGGDTENPNRKNDFEYKIITQEDKDNMDGGEYLEVGTIMITSYKGTNSDLVIPSEIDGKKVTAIDKMAFFSGDIMMNNVKSTIKTEDEFLTLIKKDNLSQDEVENCFGYVVKHENEIYNNDKIIDIVDNWMNEHSDVCDSLADFYIKNVTIPDTVTYIGNEAFSNGETDEINPNIHGINNVTFGKNVKYIGFDSFKFNNLTSVTIPNGVKEINRGSFENNKISNVVIPNGVTKIEDGAFENNKLTNVTIPNSVTYLSGFDNNELTEVTIPNSVENLSGFSYNNLTKVTIPNSVKYLTGFRNNQLTNVTIGENVKKIDDGAFKNNKLTNVVIPNGVTYLSGFDNNQLTKINIPDSVTEIGLSSFSGNQLSDVIIPDKVTRIGSFAFSDNQLANLKLGDSLTDISNGVFRNNKLTSVNMPDSLKNIDYEAFKDNLITNIKVSKNIHYMKDNSFRNNKLTEVTLPNDNCFSFYTFDKGVTINIK